MSNAKVYEEYVLRGPDVLGLGEVKRALAFRDDNPEAARRVEARLERERREAIEKADLRAEWLRQGGDERDFERAHRELSEREKTERLAATDRAAREASARRIASGF